MGGALQREPRPDCANCRGLSLLGAHFFHLTNWVVMPTQPLNALNKKARLWPSIWGP